MNYKIIGNILLALMLVSMALTSIVSAAAVQLAGVGDSDNRIQSADYPDRHIPTDYPYDSKPAQWLSESNMINIVISQKTIETFNQDSKPGIVNIPVSYLDLNTNFLSTKEEPSFLTETGLNKDEEIVLVRMPKKMYERFVNNAKDGRLSLPADYFLRYYYNSDDLYTHLKMDGDTLKVLPSEKYPLRKPSANSDSESIITDQAPVISNRKSSAILSYPIMFEARRYYNRVDESKDYDYCIGQITPMEWELIGSAMDQFDIFQEREYRFDSNEVIEVSVKYRDRNQGGDIVLFPVLYRSGAGDPIPNNQWNAWGGEIGIDKNDLPLSYGYHVQFGGGYYYVDIEDMGTMDFTSYAVTSAAGTSTFTDLWGSSEYRQRAAPTTNTFSAVTNPVIDEWAHESGAAWEKPDEAWQYVSPSTDDYVSVTKKFDSSGNLITKSYAEYP